MHQRRVQCASIRCFIINIFISRGSTKHGLQKVQCFFHQNVFKHEHLWAQDMENVRPANQKKEKNDITSIIIFKQIGIPVYLVRLGMSARIALKLESKLV